MDYDTVREALDTLLGLNDPAIPPVTKTVDDLSKEKDTPWRPMTVHELQQNNYELAANIADLLGMSDLYLDRAKSSTKQVRAGEDDDPTTKVMRKEINKGLEEIGEDKESVDEIAENVAKRIKDALSKETNNDDSIY